MKFGLLGASTLVLAISLAGVAVAQEVAVDDEILVTGTRRSDVTALASSTPVDVVSAEALQDTGSPALVQSLRTLVPSVSFSQTGGIIGGRLAQSVSLRGLPAGDTLVLVNGRRRNLTPKISTGNEWSRGSQPVDLNDIPQSAVARVEVLRDGASAQYGSDAIAGVVNVILRGGEEDGGSAYVTTGQYYEGDGFTAGVGGWYNIGLGDRGFVNLSLDTRYSEPTTRGFPFAFSYYFPGDPREATVNKTIGFYSNQLQKTAASSFNAEYELTPELTAYAFGTADYRSTRTIYFITPAANGNVRSLHPDGLMSHPTYIFRNYDAVAGLRWDAGDLGTFDLSTEYGAGSQEALLYDSENASYGAATPTDFNLGTHISSQSNTELSYVRDIATGYAAEPLTLSAGVGYRWEYFELEAGDPESYNSGGVLVLDGPNAGARPAPGATDFAGLTPADAGEYDRGVYNAYVGLEQQITEALQLGVAARFEEYDDFGSTTTAKLSGRYDFTDAFGLRASISNGFKAPSMGQIGASSTTPLWIFPAVGTPFIGGSAFLPVDNEVSRALGARDLEPEESTNYSLGFVWRPIGNASLTVDAYQIDLENVILPVDNLTGAWVTARLATFGITDVSAVRFFQNQADVQVQGIDIVGRYNLDLGESGDLDFTLAANFNESSIERVLPNPPELAGSGLTLVGRQSQGYLTQWAPESKIVASVNYNHGPFDVTFTGVRYGEYKFTAANPANDQIFDARWVAKLAVSYAVTANTSITVGADNLFDSYPEEPIPANRFGGRNHYDLQDPEGGNGGYYYITLRQNF